ARGPHTVLPDLAPVGDGAARGPAVVARSGRVGPGGALRARCRAGAARVGGPGARHARIRPEAAGALPAGAALRRGAVGSVAVPGRRVPPRGRVAGEAVPVGGGWAPCIALVAVPLDSSRSRFVERRVRLESLDPLDRSAWLL